MAIMHLGTVLKFLFVSLCCMITALIVYAIITHGFPLSRDNLTPWMAATWIDMYLMDIGIGAWISYKQSGWISTIIWIVLLVAFRSIATCLYVSIQFLKLSSKDSGKDPIYHVLQRSKKKTGASSEHRHIFTVAIGRVIFAVSGCLMLGILIYGFITFGSPVRKDVMTPWMKVTLVDFCTNLVPLMVWVAYKELSFIRFSIWSILFICLGSVPVYTYIVFQLWEFDYSDPLYLVLFNNDDRLQIGYENANDGKGGSSIVEQKYLKNNLIASSN